MLKKNNPVHEYEYPSYSTTSSYSTVKSEPLVPDADNTFYYAIKSHAQVAAAKEKAASPTKPEVKKLLL